MHNHRLANKLLHLISDNYNGISLIRGTSSAKSRRFNEEVFPDLNWKLALMWTKVNSKVMLTGKIVRLRSDLVAGHPTRMKIHSLLLHALLHFFKIKPFSHELLFISSLQHCTNIAPFILTQKLVFSLFNIGGAGEF